jgi:hypothetical protein
MTQTPYSLVFSLLLWASACGAPALAPVRAEQTRFKGVELYSWQAASGHWMFSLMDGTNRMKAVDEIKRTECSLHGLGALASEFSKLAVGEQVFWIHPTSGFEIPAPDMRDAILRSAKAARVSLSLPAGSVPME